MNGGAVRSALLTEGHERSMVAVAHSLHRAGISVSLVGGRTPAPAQWSRVAVESFRLPPPAGSGEAFSAGLASILSARRYDMLLVGGDAALLAVSRHRERLEGLTRLALPSAEVVERAIDKSELHRAATAAGLPPPRTVTCDGPEAARAAAAELGYPLLVKPECAVVRAAADMTQGSSCIADGEAALATLVPRLGPRVLLQQAVSGPVCSFAGILAGSELRVRAYSRYERTWPPRAGSASCSRTLTPSADLCERVEALMRDIGWEGIFELELIIDPDGGAHAIDLNPRVYGSISLAISAGADLPALWAGWVLDGLLPPLTTAAPGHRYRWEEGELGNALLALRDLRLRDAAAIALPRRGTTHAHTPFGDRRPLGALAARWGGRLAMQLLGPREGDADALAAFRRRPQAAGREPAEAQQPPPAAAARAGGARRAPVVVIGAGPYGLAAAAHLRGAGIETLAFGTAMDSWAQRMPAGMLLRSTRKASSISDPRRRFGIDAHTEDTGRAWTPVIALEEFVDYGRWFQRRAVPDLDEQRRIERVEQTAAGFGVALDDGSELSASRVVVAAGTLPFARRPAPLGELPRELVSHVADHHDLAPFAGRAVVVVGGGQSAREQAALLSEAGAAVELLVRAPELAWLRPIGPDGNGEASLWPLPPTDVGGRGSGWLAALPDAFHRMPARTRRAVIARCLRPIASYELQARLERVRMTLGREVTAAEAIPAAEGAGAKVRLHLDDNSERTVDHVMLATGYSADISRYPFLASELCERVATRHGAPLLGAGLESSVPGLHFIGYSAMPSYGPIMCFVVGTWYAAPALTAHIAGRPRPLLRTAF